MVGGLVRAERVRAAPGRRIGRRPSRGLQPITLERRRATGGGTGGRGVSRPPAARTPAACAARRGGSSLSYIDWVEQGTLRPRPLQARVAGGQYSWNVSPRQPAPSTSLAYTGDAPSRPPTATAAAGSFWFQVLCPPYVALPSTCSSTKYRLNAEPSTTCSSVHGHGLPQQLRVVFGPGRTRRRPRTHGGGSRRVEGGGRGPSPVDPRGWRQQLHVDPFGRSSTASRFQARSFSINSSWPYEPRLAGPGGGHCP